MKMGRALIGSLLLHAGVLALAFLNWNTLPDAKPVVSVPVQIVAELPERSMAAAPFDETAVLEPVPEPAPAEPVPTPEPEPVLTPPAPKQPVPEVKKETKKPEPKKLEPVKSAKTKPDPKGTQKPKPQTLDLGALSQYQSSPPKSNTRTPARPTRTPTDGSSARGSAAADTGPALNALTAKLQRLWSPNCDVPGGDQVRAVIAFTISPNGRVIKGPEWQNPRNDPVWQAAAGRAQAAVKKGELYDNLPDGLYNQPLEITFNAQKACAGA